MAKKALTEKEFKLKWRSKLDHSENKIHIASEAMHAAQKAFEEESKRVKPAPGRKYIETARFEALWYAAERRVWLANKEYDATLKAYYAAKKKIELWDLVESNDPRALRAVSYAIENGFINDNVRFCISLMRFAEKTCPDVYTRFLQAGLKAYN